MKRIVIIALAVIMVATIFVACQKAEEDAVPTQVSSEETPAAVEDGGGAAEEQSGAPEDASPTTGLAGHPEYKPVIIQIENEPAARPQAGLTYADIVYETMIEAQATRFTCVYNDTYPEEVGPVRSARYYHQLIQQEWDGIFAHMGGANDPNFPQTYIYGESGEHIKQRLDFTKEEDPNLIWRRKNTGKSLDHTAYANVANIAAKYNYDPVQRQSFKFYPLEEYANEKAFDTLKLGFWRQPGFVEYRYDEAKDKLVRYCKDNDEDNGNIVEHIAEETGEAIEVQNVIVQYVSILEAPNEGGRKIVEMIGEGPAEFFIHGKHMQGYWSRPSQGDITKFYLDNGQEVTLAPGNTWIEVHPNNKSIVVEYSDGTQYDSHAG